MAMALLLLASTITWKVEKHYCMGRVMDIAFFHEVSKCGMDIFNDVESSDLSTMHCCDDKVILVEGQDEMQSFVLDYTLDIQFFVYSYAVSYLDLFAINVSQLIPHQEYPPPILIEDITVLDQVFLI